jgi:YceI-like domain
MSFFKPAKENNSLSFSSMKFVMILILFLFYSVVLAQPILTSNFNFNCTLKSITIEGFTNINHFYFTFRNPKENEGLFQNKILNRTTNNQIKFFIPVQDFNSNNTFMDYDFRKLLKASEFPEVTVSFDKDLVEKILSEKSSKQLDLYLTLTGVTRSIKVESAESEEEHGELEFSGNTYFNLSDFGLEAPEKMFGLIKVLDKVEISFNILFISTVQTSQVPFTGNN